MSIIRGLNIEYNLNTGVINILYKRDMHNTDVNSGVIYVRLVYNEEGGPINYINDISEHSLVLYVEDRENNKFYLEPTSDSSRFIFKLPSDFTNIVGPHKCCLIDTFIEDNYEKKVTSNSFNYVIKENDISNVNSSVEKISQVTYDAANEMLIFKHE